MARYFPLFLFLFAAPVMCTAATGQTDSPANSLLKRFEDGEYGAVGSIGPDVLRQDPDNDRLRLAVAQSLAWSGRLSDAINHYRRLLASRYHREAMIGLADVYRWSGRPDRAIGYYRRVLKEDPGNAESKHGLLLCERELADTTSFEAGHSADSTGMRRNEFSLRHTWRDSSQTQIFSIAVDRSHDVRDPLAEDMRDLALAYQHLAAPLAPRIELVTQTTPDRAVFGDLQLTLMDDPVVLHLGHVNWGYLAFNVDALEKGLTANHVGLQAREAVRIGEFRFVVDYYSVSDSNTVWDSSLRYTPLWRPLGPDVKPYLGLAYRTADFNTADYWSPANQYLSDYFGVEIEWDFNRWTGSLFGQYGFGLAGEAANNWSAGTEFKFWIAPKYAIGFRGWAQDNPRTSSYRSHGVLLRLEKLW